MIHLSGTNGKGSTAAMIESLLRADGLRTGRFTSPHVTSVTERITIDGAPISEERFDEVWREIEPYVALVDEQQIDGVSMTFFEIITAMAYAAFADAPVDVAVVEVGLGGTWDATNVADADVAVITPIDLDHTHLLGNTIAEIATEKAGIIKPGAHAILAGQPLEAAQVLLQRCADVGALPQREGIDFGVIDRQLAVGGQVIRINGAEGPIDDVFLPLHGAHQAANAAQALAAVEAFLGLKALNPDVAREGYRPGDGSPGRMEVVRRSPTVVLDAAHNPHGARATAAAVTEAFRFSPLIGVVAVMADKDARGLLEVFEELMNQVVVTQVGLDHAWPARRGAGRTGRGDLRRRAGHRRAAARRRDRDGPSSLAETEGAGAPGVLITGSVVAVGEARTLLVRRGAVGRDPTSDDDPDDDWDADYAESENGQEPDRELWT